MKTTFTLLLGISLGVVIHISVQKINPSVIVPPPAPVGQTFPGEPLPKLESLADKCNTTLIGREGQWYQRTALDNDAVLEIDRGRHRTSVWLHVRCSPSSDCIRTKEKVWPR